MPKFKVVLERTDTITRQAVVMVEAATAGEARQTILAELEVDRSSYDNALVEVESGVGEMIVEVEQSGNERHSEPQHARGSLVPLARLVIRATRRIR